MPAPKQTKVKFPRAKAAKIIKKVEKHIKPFVDRQMACGSYRRGAQMIGDIDFVVIPKEGVTLPQMLPPNEGINWVGDNKAQVVIDGEKVDFKVTTPDAWGATILYFTGPADFNIKYRWMAKKRGMKLNEYGLFDRKTDAYIAGATEQDIYDALKRPFRDPDQRTGWKRAESSEILLHPYRQTDLQINLLEEFPNAKNFDALLYENALLYEQQGEIRTLNSMEELLSSDWSGYGDWQNIYYINFPLKVFRGVNTKGENQQWTWKRWLEGDKMGTSTNMGIDNTQPTTLNIQEALDYASAALKGGANGISRSPRDPEMMDYELYAIDIQDYFIKMPRPSQQYNHKNCNPVYKCPSCNMESDSILFDNACPEKAPQRYFVPSCNFKFASCDNPNHIKTETPVIFILGGAHYEDMTVLWDPDVKSSYFEAPFRDPDQRTGWKRAESFETEVGKKGEVAWRAMNPHDYAIGLAEGYIPMSRTGGGGFHAVTKLPNHIIRAWQGFPLFEIDIEGLEYYQGHMDNVYPGHVVIVDDIPIEKVMPIDSDLGMDQVSSYNLTKKGKKKYVRGAWTPPRVQRPWIQWSDRFEAPYQPDQELSDYNPQGLMTSSVITGDYTVDSLKFGQTTLSAETFGSENQWIVNNLTMLLTQRARTLSELIDDLGIRGITVESNLVRNSTFVRVGKHVPAVWGLSGQDYSRKHPYNAISPAAGRKQHLKTMFEKLDPRELDWDDDVTWNQPEVEDWSDEVSWDAEEIKPRCPICFGFIPNNANPGAYPGALSRYDNATEICSSCGQAEGMSGLFLGSVGQDKIADMEAIEDPWLRHTYLINLVTEVMPAAFRGE